MALVTIKEMLEKARNEKYCVGAFDASTIEMAMKIVEAAEEKKSPVIIMALTPDLQQGNGAYLDYWVYSLRKMAENASVPVCLQLDHATDMEFLKKCVDAGFTSVMFTFSCSAVMSVFIIPGATALILIPYFATSLACEIINVTSPAFADA